MAAIMAIIAHCVTRNEVEQCRTFNAKFQFCHADLKWWESGVEGGGQKWTEPEPLWNCSVLAHNFSNKWKTPEMWQMICKTDSGHAKVFIEQVEQENASYFGNQRRENKKKRTLMASLLSLISAMIHRSRNRCARFYKVFQICPNTFSLA